MFTDSQPDLALLQKRSGRWTKENMLIRRLSRRSNFPHLDSAAPYILNHDAADVGAELDVAGQSGRQLRDRIFGRTKRGTQELQHEGLPSEDHY
jgi:hypothetical protein